MKVFISHSHRDTKLAKRLADYLEKENIKVWFSARDVLAGDNWAKEIASALESSDTMIVLFSRNSLKSTIVRREVEYALGQEGYSNRLIPVVIGGEDVLTSPNFPWILRRLKPIRMSARSPREAFQKVEQALRQIA